MLCLVFGFAMCFLVAEVLALPSQSWGPAPAGHPQCMVQSLDLYGQPAYCDAWSNTWCPNPDDTCRPFPGTSYGPCCLGCRFGPPLPGRVCSGWGGVQCPAGFYCRTSPAVADGVGVCCAGGYSINDDLDKPEVSDHGPFPAIAPLPEHVSEHLEEKPHLEYIKEKAEENPVQERMSEASEEISDQTKHNPFLGLWYPMNLLFGQDRDGLGDS